MKDDRSDRIVRAALSELRSADEGDAPAFADVLARPAHVVQWLPQRAILSVAATLLLALGAGYRAYVTQGHRLVVPSEVIALSAWTSPTDVLLENHVSPLLKYAPRLGASLIDTVTRGKLQ